jgi:hypothetical protein
MIDKSKMEFFFNIHLALFLHRLSLILTKIKFFFQNTVFLLILLKRYRESISALIRINTNAISYYYDHP